MYANSNNAIASSQAAADLHEVTKKTLQAAKKERKAIIAELLQAEKTSSEQQ